MNIRDLEYVTAVADLRSFSEAAHQCGVSQPTLSAQIKKLEERLGVQLFERTNKRVVPTEVGQGVLLSAYRILHEVEMIKETAESAHDPFAGRYRLGAFPTLASYLFPDLVPYLKEKMPKLHLILIEEKSDILLDKLRHGKIDAAFLAMPVKDDFLKADALFDDPFYVAVNAENSLALEKNISAKSLHQQKLLLLEEGHCLRDQALDVCNTMGVSDDTDLRATSLETLRQMVRIGTGITLIPEIARTFTDDEIKYIPFKGTPPYRKIALVCRKTCSREKIFEMIKAATLKTR